MNSQSTLFNLPSIPQVASHSRSAYIKRYEIQGKTNYTKQTSHQMGALWIPTQYIVPQLFSKILIAKKLFITSIKNFIRVIHEEKDMF